MLRIGFINSMLKLIATFFNNNCTKQCLEEISNCQMLIYWLSNWKMPDYQISKWNCQMSNVKLSSFKLSNVKQSEGRFLEQQCRSRPDLFPRTPPPRLALAPRSLGITAVSDNVRRFAGIDRPPRRVVLSGCGRDGGPAASRGANALGRSGARGIWRCGAARAEIHAS